MISYIFFIQKRASFYIKKATFFKAAFFSFVLRFRKQQMIEEQQPNEVQNTDCNTGRNGYENREDKRNKTLRFQPSRPTNADFHYPVYNGDQKENKLHQFVLLIKPFCKH